MRWLAFSLLLFGCSSTATPPEATQDSGAAVFVAFEQDFKGFRTWEKFSFAETSDAFPAHLGGPRDVYLNKRPPKGSKEFPIGTIIVKEVLDGGPFIDRIIFARVKRGSGFNPDANGWEWFQLKNRADGSTSIFWRGLGPPGADQDAAGPGYLGDADGCTPCHKGAIDNDLVMGAPLRLSSL